GGAEACEVVPGAGALAGAAVDDEAVGVLGDLGVEVVQQHAQGRLLDPALAGALGAARGAQGAGGSGGEGGGGHERPPGEVMLPRLGATPGRIIPLPFPNRLKTPRPSARSSGPRQRAAP